MSVETILIILVLLAGFYMAWNIGANDVSNAMGTSVGSGALTLTKAVIIAGVLEFCGAYFMGAHVSETMQRGLVYPEVFAADPRILLYGMFAALLSTAIWLQIASYFGWPVSTTHAIVGAILGFGVVIGGMHAINWLEVQKIAAGWVISPVISGLFAYIIFSILQRKILFAMNPILATKKLLPILIGVVFMTFAFSILANGMGSLNLDFSFRITLGIAALVGIVAWAISAFWIKRVKVVKDYEKRSSPHLSSQVVSLNKAMKHLQRVKISSKGDKRAEVAALLRNVRTLNETIKEESGFNKRTTDYQSVEKLFAILQIFSASYVAFAHGANDVANAIGPIAAALEIIRKGHLSLQTTIPSWLLAMGGLGIVIGLATWGWRVIETIGKKITELTPTRGFAAEFGAAVTILIASKLGLPISTTHCIVGAVLGVGLARGLAALNLRMIRDIALSWVVTIPSSAIVSVIFFYLIKAIFY
ncbi:MAG: inorganic phosphate transporter [Simkaniaceae bacterium]|nr:inorganic phosphate transporter [Simkaniaceae bacterium]